VLPELEQKGVVPVQALLQLPQWVGEVMSVSQPSLAMPLQSAQPGAHEVGGIEHIPAPHDVGPLTWATPAQSCPQVPQL
jgi:hypothetical protein